MIQKTGSERYCKQEIITCHRKESNMEEKKIERLYELLDRAEEEADTEAVAALRWAIFTLEQTVGCRQAAGRNQEEAEPAYCR